MPTLVAPHLKNLLAPFLEKGACMFSQRKWKTALAAASSARVVKLELSQITLKTDQSDVLTFLTTKHNDHDWFLVMITMESVWREQVVHLVKNLCLFRIYLGNHSYQQWNSKILKIYTNSVSIWELWKCETSFKDWEFLRGSTSIWELAEIRKIYWVMGIL